jgi:hypothetical protein
MSTACHLNFFHNLNALKFKIYTFFQGYNSVDLLYLADKYQVESLKISRTTELARLIDCSNAVHRLLFATQISCLDLVSAAAKFIARHRQEFFDTKVWKDAIEDNPEVMEAILKFGFE